MHQPRTFLLASLLGLAACSAKEQNDTHTPEAPAPDAVAAAAAEVPKPAAADAPAPADAPENIAPINAEAYAFTLNGGPFSNLRVAVAHPTDPQRPGAAIGFWSAQRDMGTQLDAVNEKPTGVLLRVPSAPADKPGTYPISGGVVMRTGEGGIGDLPIDKGTVTITRYGSRVVGTFEGTGTYTDMQNGMKQSTVTISNGTFDLKRGSNR
ncbi:hypothetical protein [Hymenobacter coalescens]